MFQELFRIPGLDWPVYGYGLMLVLGVFAAIELGRYLANRVGLNGDHFVTMGLLALALGVVGARLSHVLENLELYTRDDRTVLQNFQAMVNLSNGGLTFYGGFLFGTPFLILYAWWRKIPLRLGMDLVAPCLMIGLAFGRVGCLLNGCCWGHTVNPDAVPWAVTFPYASPPFEDHFEDGRLEVPPALTEAVRLENGEVVSVLKEKKEVARDPALATVARSQRSLPVHPTQVYSSLNALLIAGVCLAFFTMRRSTGQNFALMLILYSIGRFTLETLRIEPAVPLFGVIDLNFSYSMWVACFTFLAGIAMWLFCAAVYRPAPTAETAPGAVPAAA